MREHRFRGKRIDNGEWAYGYLCDKDCINHVEEWQPNESDTSDGYSEDYSVDPETIGEFTGLKDKNGVDIYGGDLIQDERTGLIFEVVWNEGYAGWWCVSKYKSTEQPLNEINQHCVNIGNIHESEVSND